MAISVCQTEEKAGRRKSPSVVGWVVLFEWGRGRSLSQQKTKQRKDGGGGDDGFRFGNPKLYVLP